MYIHAYMYLIRHPASRGDGCDIFTYVRIYICIYIYIYVCIYTYTQIDYRRSEQMLHVLVRHPATRGAGRLI